ncbi:MAG: hypothetical protein UY67_C0006G0037 [Candidatus Kaiserbacteria bacterium GW2011_GWA2_52_12]|uniref:AAA+ ATPase domain-containing protein n=1 Tax=Candidatus Kaiserbacteria bacterium GW2011_GWA2_52_12 TaxID=1618671 RepID=A0A0G1ZA44_9BACT|nr:MAG: hypothetical protein UY67_C0006G0037 [Candidatus Kaiserbacteria bacterium GW2011_GWA2_52_12]
MLSRRLWEGSKRPVRRDTFMMMKEAATLKKPEAVVERWMDRFLKDALEAQLPKRFSSMSAGEKAQELYDIVSFVRMAGSEKSESEDVALLRSRASALASDKETRNTFARVFARGRAEIKGTERSPLYGNIAQMTRSTGALSLRHRELEHKLFIGDVKGPASEKLTREELMESAGDLAKMRVERDALTRLEGEEKTADKTDVAAHLMHETLGRYHDEAEKGFAWLPSRLDIHRSIRAALSNGRFPLLVGEPGVGKSEQADAVAEQLTDDKCVKIACTSSTGEHDLIADKEIDERGSYLRYGAASRAATGFVSSRDNRPERMHGRIVRADELLKINFDKTFGLIKEIAQKKPGDQMHENVQHPVLKGFSLIATTNPAGARHQLDKLPPALEREFAEIKVDYPPQSPENPELYEFMLATLMDDKKYISIPKSELAPAYERKEVVNQKTKDGRDIAAEEKIIATSNDARHGTLWRVANAIRAIQDSYTADNPDERARLEPSLLRFNPTTNAVVAQNAPNAEPLTLQSSTMTLKEISSWMRGFGTRMESADPSLRAKTFSDWLSYKANVFVSQCPPNDRAKMEAVFKHFSILTPTPTNSTEPMTNLDIGYLSPRVPRPLEIKGETARHSTDIPREVSESRTVETVEYLTEKGERVRAKPTDYDIGAIQGSRFNYTIRSGATFKKEGVKYAGVNAEKPEELILISGELARSLSKDAFLAELAKECVLTVEAAERAIGRERLWADADIKDAFGFTPEKVFLVPYSAQELKDYKARDCMLQLVVEKMPDGTPLTIEKMAELVGSNVEGRDRSGNPNKFRLYKDQFGENGEMLGSAWFSGPQYAAIRAQMPKAGWQVVSRKTINGTKSLSYIPQTEKLIAYAKETFGGTFPPAYAEAERQFVREKLGIETLMKDDKNSNRFIEASDKLSKLSISQLLREPSANMMFRYLVGTKSRNERLLTDEYTWSNTPSGVGHLVSFGHADAGGAHVNRHRPDYAWNDIGAVFSRIES